MTDYQRPGVYVEETLNPIAPVLGPESTAVAAFLGASDRGPVEPTLVTSWSQYVNLYGGWNTNNSNGNKLPHAVYMFFSNGGNSAYIQRVVDPLAVKGTRVFKDDSLVDSLRVTALNPGTWASDVYIRISPVRDANRGVGTPNYVYDLTVYYGGTKAANVVERFTTVSNNSAKTRFVENMVNGNSSYISVTALSDEFPSAVTPDSNYLAGSTDGDVVTEDMVAAAVTSFDTVRNSLVMNACGVTTTTYVNELIDYAEERQDVFLVIDPSVYEIDDQLTLALDYTPTSLAAIYYPPVTIVDPAAKVKGATKAISPAGAVIGLYASTDVSRGVFKAPAGVQARLSNVVSIPTLTNAQLDAMNTAEAPVNAIRFIPGSGFVVMGARTLKIDAIDRYVPVRRTLIYLRKSLTDLTQFAVFEPNDETLWLRLEDVCTKFLTSFWQTGGLRGDVPADAFFVKCDEENNTLTTIDAGEVIVEVGVALQRPAEYVIIKIGQFEGGATVTVV